MKIKLSNSDDELKIIYGNSNIIIQNRTISSSQIYEIFKNKSLDEIKGMEIDVADKSVDTLELKTVIEMIRNKIVAPESEK